MKSVRTDMNDHTVTVSFDDEEITVDDIVSALATAGYAVPGSTKLD